jgi:hypothetical protein
LAAKVISGARAKVLIVDPNTGKSGVIGIWNNFSYNMTVDVQPSFILGRYSAAALTTTGVEPVSITAQGWRIVNHGPFVDGHLMNIKDILKQESLMMQVIDRQTGAPIATIIGCYPTGTSSTVSAKQLMEMTNTYVGLLLSDESAENNEAGDSTSFDGL